MALKFAAGSSISGESEKAACMSPGAAFPATRFRTSSPRRRTEPAARERRSRSSSTRATDSFSCASTAILMTASTSCGSMGFSMYPTAWRRIAVFRYSLSAYPLRKTTLHEGQRTRIRRASSSPSMRGILTSVSRISGGSSEERASASAPFRAVRTRPMLSELHGTKVFRLSLVIFSSSTIRSPSTTHPRAPV